MYFLVMINWHSEIPHHQPCQGQNCGRLVNNKILKTCKKIQLDSTFT